jgi:hypothetical protein
MKLNETTKRVDSETFRALLRQAQDDVALFYSIVAEADEIVLFGSRAVGVCTSNSDWDLFCVGSGKRTRRNGFYVVWRSHTEIEQKVWCQSELAAHIAYYGKWIRGSGESARQVELTSAAVDEKTRRILRSINAVIHRWSALSPPFRRARAIRIWRDFQRLEYLLNGEPVPPTAVLDLESKEGRSASDQAIRKVIALAPIEQHEFIAQMLSHSVPHHAK